MPRFCTCATAKLASKIMRIRLSCRTARRAAALMCWLALGVALASCGGKSSSTTAGPAATVKITPLKASVLINQRQSFAATAQDSSGNTATTSTFSWTSSAPNVASIDGNGFALGRSNGTTQITASAAGANNTIVTSAPATLTVTQPIASITISPSNPTIAVNATQQFTAAAMDANGNTMPGVVFAWACSSSVIATIDSNGLATGVKPGTVFINASASGVTSPLATLTVTP
jgi:trimeric autotransporter adhesin